MKTFGIEARTIFAADDPMERAMTTTQAIKAVLLVALLVLASTALQAQAANPDPATVVASAADKSAQAAHKAASEAALYAKAAAAAASSAEAAAPHAWRAPDAWALYLVPAFALLAAVVAMMLINKALSSTKWSLADALSEEVMMPAYTEAVAATATTPAEPRKLMQDKNEKPVLIPELHASSSRLIALMGMMAILFLFLGFGVFAIFQFGATGKVPESLEQVGTFLLSGMTLFAPYLVNKFASVFKPPATGK